MPKTSPQAKLRICDFVILLSFAFRHSEFVNMHLKWSEPIRELSVLRLHLPRRFEHYLTFRNRTWQTVELNLRGCSLTFAGENKKVAANFPHAKLHPVRAVNLNGQRGIWRHQRRIQRALAPNFFNDRAQHFLPERPIPAQRLVRRRQSSSIIAAEINQPARSFDNGFIGHEPFLGERWKT